MRTRRQQRIRQVVSSLLLTLLFVLTNAPLLSALLASGSSCGAKCCRSHKAGCCRKKAPNPSGPSLMAHRCPPDCGHQPALPSESGWTLVSNLDVAAWEVAVVVLLIAAVATLWAAHLAFPLLSRPPPAAALAA